MMAVVKRFAWWVMSLVVLVLSGCSPEPTPVGLLPRPPAAAPAPTVFLILPAAPDSQVDLMTWVAAAEMACDEAHAVFRVLGPGPKETSDRQPSLIAQALKSGATALVVVPENSAALVASLAEAESRGVPVVTLGTAEPASPPLPGTTIIPEPFADSANRLVQAIVEDGRRLGLPNPLPLALLRDNLGDRFAAQRVKALTDAAARAGVVNLVVLGYDIPNNQTDGRDQALKTLVEGMKTHPEVRAVLAEGDHALVAANRVRNEAPPDRPILVAGYLGYRGQTNPEDMRGNSAFVEGRLDSLVRDAVRTVLDRVADRTRPVEPVRVSRTPFNRAVGDTIRTLKRPAQPPKGPEPLPETSPPPQPKSVASPPSPK